MASRRFRARKTLTKSMDRLGRRMRYVEKRTSKKRLNPRVVTTEKLFARTVTTPKIAENAVTTEIIAENAVGTIQIQPGAVTTDEISFDAGDIGGMASSVIPTQPTSPNVGDIWFDSSDNYNLKRWNGSVWESVRDATIAVAQAAANAAQNTANNKNKVYRQATAPTGAIAVGDLWFNTSQDNKPNRWNGAAWEDYGFGNLAIGNLDAAKISTGSLAADRIASNSLDASKITAGTITTDRFTANTINASVITGGTITAAKLSADSIDGKTITGATVQTSSGGTSKVVLNTGGLKAIDSLGATTVSINTDGSAEFKGTITATSFTASGLVDANDLAPNSVTNVKIEDGAITNAKIDSLSADKINAGSINAAVISVTNINADAITAGSVTGRTFQSTDSSPYGKYMLITATSSPEIKMTDDSNDLIRLYALDGLRMRWQNNLVSTRINLTDSTNRLQIDTNNSTYAVEVGGSVNATGQLRCAGNGTIGGNLAVTGTITGTVATANNSSFLGGQAASAYLRSNEADTHSGGTLTVGVLQISNTVGIGGGYGVTSSWSPQTDNSPSLGQSTRRWNAVWATDTTINSSDARQKKDIIDEPLGLEFINALRPRAFKWVESHKDVVLDDDGNQVLDENGEQAHVSVPGTRLHHGFISQEIKETYPAFIDDFAAWVLADKNDPNSSQFLRYTEFIGPLTKAVQELSEKVVSLEARIQAMEG